MTATPTATTDAALYRLLAWLSPAFPVGAFSYSHALEAAVEAGLVRDRESLIAWTRAVLAHGAGRVDAALFAHALRAVAADDEGSFLAIARRASVLRGTSELALESLGPGAAFVATLRAAWPEATFARWSGVLERAGVPPAYAIAVALAAATAGVPLAAALIAYLQAFAANIVSAGVRLIPLGQTDGQRALAALEPVVAACLAAALACKAEDIGAAAPMIDILSMRHETQYTRLFRS